MNYRKFLFAFILNAIIVASITAFSIEARFTIKDNVNKIKIDKDNLMQKILYYLHALPYYISSRLDILKDGDKAPEYINIIYIFLITFIVAIFIYHIFFVVLGQKTIYSFYFGNL